MIEILPIFEEIKDDKDKMIDVLGTYLNERQYKVTKAEPSVVFNEDVAKKVGERIIRKSRI